MTPDPAHVAHARQVADAVLYEGYLLYPYRQSAQKNRTRFQFGVLMPPQYRAVDDCEPSASQTECLVECADDATVDILVRFLHFQRRAVQRLMPGTGAISEVDTLWVDGTEYTSWDEAVERERSFRVSVADLLGQDTELVFRISAGEEVEGLTGSEGIRAGQLIRHREQLDAAIAVRAERVAGPYQALRLHLRLENRSQPRVRLRCRLDGDLVRRAGRRGGGGLGHASKRKPTHGNVRMVHRRDGTIGSNGGDWRGDVVSLRRL